MSLAIVYSRSRSGISAPLVTVEVLITNGLPSLSIVGLPETTVKESKDRVRGAIISSHFEFPAQRITINLAPADLPKEGGRFDLAIALGILAASEQIPNKRFEQFECVGELSLNGELRSITAALPVAIQAKQAGRQLILPQANCAEAALIDHVVLFPATHLLEVCAHLSGQKSLIQYLSTVEPTALPSSSDFADVQGQAHVKRAFEIAATGRHNLLLFGSPGTGKSMLSTRFPSILPHLTEQQAQQTAAIASVSRQGFDVKQWRIPPFRSPHHTASAPALVGGGSQPMPGEISLAHHGILFLDELPEFDRKVLEVLREPLETGHITISRATHQVDFPAKFQLIAAMNPCPCGYLGDASGRCHCTSEQVVRYRGKISGPLLDRIDMHIEVPRVSHQVLRQESHKTEESSEQIKQRVIIARHKAIKRQYKLNSELLAKEVGLFCGLSPQGHQLLEQAMDKFGLSHRAYHRILKLSRTIADLAGSDAIEMNHLSEAIGYRKLDRQQ